MTTLSTLFSLANLSVLPAWMLMIVAPRRPLTERLVSSAWIFLAPIAIYAVLVVPALASVLPIVARPELAPVRALLGSPLGATAAWAHFLAFDLFVGRFIFLDAKARGFPARVVSPILLLTLLLGPLGLVAYLGYRALRGSTAGARVRDLVRQATAESRPLMRLGAASLGLLLFALVAQLFDHRAVLGASVWAKPAKFAASVALTAATLALLLRHLSAPARGRRIAVGLVAWLTGLELVIITLQSIRGVPSHFNAATPFDAAMFGLMGAGIVVVTVGIGYLGYRAFRQRLAHLPARERALGWGIRLGFVTMLFGSAIGGLMPSPTAAQRAQIAAGEKPALVGGHTVGAADGGPGLPVTRWSTTHGDLRVPHFLGLHALQLLPLAALLLGRRRRGDGAALTIVVGAGYLGLTAVALVEALRGRPLLAPDAVTLALAALVLAACAAAAAIVVRSPSLTPSRFSASPDRVASGS
jgi:ABA DEFICIENT 4-like